MKANIRRHHDTSLLVKTFQSQSFSERCGETRPEVEHIFPLDVLIRFNQVTST